MAPTATPTTAPVGYLSTAEVSRRFFAGLSAQTIRKFVSQDGLPAHRVVRRLYFNPAEVDAWIRARGGQPDAPPDPYREHIKKLVDAAPPLTAEQADRIRAVLSSGAA